MSIARTSDGFLWIVLVVLAILILFPLLMMVFALPMMGMMGWWWGNGVMGGGLSPLWGFGMMLVWLLVLVGIGYFLYRELIGRVETDRATDPALEELRLAYARGDFTEDEYEERRQNLKRDD